jgi:DNA transformation protein
MDDTGEADDLAGGALREATVNAAPIESLPNLDPKGGQWLREVGVHTAADLEQLGPVVAFRIVKQRQPKASLNLLWALAAGLNGKDWRELSEATKRRLRKKADEV